MGWRWVEVGASIGVGAAAAGVGAAEEVFYFWSRNLYYVQDILGDNSEVPIRVRNWYKSVDDKILKPLLLRQEVRDSNKVRERE